MVINKNIQYNFKLDGVLNITQFWACSKVFPIFCWVVYFSIKNFFLSLKTFYNLVKYKRPCSFKDLVEDRGKIPIGSCSGWSTIWEK